MESYIKYDDLGILEVCCLSCGNPVAVRSFQTVTVKSIPPRTENVVSMKRLSLWRRRKYFLNDGSYMDIILCNECENMDINPEKIEKAIENAWEKTLEQENKNNKEIKDYIKALPKIERSREKIEKYKNKELIG